MSWLLPTMDILRGLHGPARTIRNNDTGPDLEPRKRTESEREARRRRYRNNPGPERESSRQRMAARYKRRRAA